jgi:uncharacterized protein YciI
MKVIQVLISAALGASLLGVAVSQQSSNSTSQSHTGSNNASASSSSSANSRGFGQQAANASQSGRGSGSGSGSGIHIPKPTHAILFAPTDNWSQQAYDRIKPARTAYFAKLQAAAKLIYFGPWRDTAGEMSILVGTDAEMKQIAHDDPAVQSGLLTAEVRGWTVEVEPYSPVTSLGAGG